jgi:hypothetical protein
VNAISFKPNYHLTYLFVLDIKINEVISCGLLKNKEDSFIACSCDSLALAEISGVEELVAVEIITNISQESTNETFNRKRVLGPVSIYVASNVDSDDSEFNQLIPDKNFRVKCLHQAISIGSKYSLLVESSLTSIIR